MIRIQTVVFSFWLGLLFSSIISWAPCQILPPPHLEISTKLDHGVCIYWFFLLYPLKILIILMFPLNKLKINALDVNHSGDSSVGRASDWRSEGRVFDPRSPHNCFSFDFFFFILVHWVSIFIIIKHSSPWVFSTLSYLTILNKI